MTWRAYRTLRKEVYPGYQAWDDKKCVFYWTPFLGNERHDSFVRATSGTAKNSSGEWITYAANEPRWEYFNGLWWLRHEKAATNYFINSEAPVTQTISITSSTVPYCLWIEGAGSADVAAGTATIDSGGTATAGAGNHFRFTCSASGTVVVTINAPVTRCQLELNWMPTAYIQTAGTAATRNSEAAYPQWALTNALTTLLTTAKSFAVFVEYVPLFNFNEPGTAVYADLLNSHNGQFMIYTTGATGYVYTSDGTSGSAFTYNWARDTVNKAVLRVYENGTKKQVSNNVSGSWQYSVGNAYDGAYTITSGLLRIGSVVWPLLFGRCAIYAGEWTQAQCENWPGWRF